MQVPAQAGRGCPPCPHTGHCFSITRCRTVRALWTEAVAAAALSDTARCIPWCWQTPAGKPASAGPSRHVVWKRLLSHRTPVQGEVSSRRNNVMRADTEKGGSYRRTPKLMVHSKCLCCDPLRGIQSLFPIPFSTLGSVPAPPRLWMPAGA